jgi:hypothetical protein
MPLAGRVRARAFHNILICCLIIGVLAPAWQVAAQDVVPNRTESEVEAPEEEQVPLDPPVVESPPEAPTEEFPVGEPPAEPTQEPPSTLAPTLEPTPPADLPTATLTPTVEPTATSEPTATDELVYVNTDAMVVTSQSGEGPLQPGESRTIALEHSVTTPRRSTIITASLFDARGSVASTWVVQADSGASGNGTVTFSEGTTTGPNNSFAVTLTITAPANVLADESVTLHLSSVVERIDGSTEPGVIDTTALAALTVIAPLPTIQPTTVPVSDQFVPYSTEPLTVGSDGTFQATLAYSVTTDRISTTFNAAVIDQSTGLTVAGWHVALNGQPWKLTNTGSVTAGSLIQLTVTGTVDPANLPLDPAPQLTLQLTSDVTVSIDPEQTLPGAIHSIALSIDEESGFSAQAVNNSSTQLVCTGPDGTTTNIDNVAPGQIITYRCDFTITGISVLSPIVSSVTLEALDGRAWTQSVSSQSLAVTGGLPVVGSESAFTSSPISFTTQTVLTLGINRSTFFVRLKAPETALPPSGSTLSARISVNSRCGGVNVLSDCGLGPTARTSQLTATIGTATGVTHTGGGLVNGISLLGLDAGAVLFELTCDNPGSFVAFPGETLQATCRLRSTATLNALTIASLTGAITAASVPPGWKITSPDSSSSELLNIDLSSRVAQITAVNGYAFTVNYTAPATCSVGASPVVNSIRLTSTYGLTVNVAGNPLLAVPLTDSNVVIPVELRNPAQTAAPSAAITGGTLDFGSFTWNGTSYQPTSAGAGTANTSITVSRPASGCTSNTWSVNVSTATVMSNGSGGAIAPANMSYTGAAGSSTPTSAIGSTLVNGSSTSFDGTATLNVPAYFSLDIPSSPAPDIGIYTGTITIQVTASSP